MTWERDLGRNERLFSEHVPALQFGRRYFAIGAHFLLLRGRNLRTSISIPLASMPALDFLTSAILWGMALEICVNI